MITSRELEAALYDWWWQETGNEAGYMSEIAAELMEAVESSPIELDDLGQLKHVLTEGGEGQGEQYYGVFSLGNQLFRLDGYYSSWDGISWDDADLYEVEAKQVTVTHYVKKK